MQETPVQSMGQEDPLEKELETHSSVLAGEFHGQRNLAGDSPQGREESDTTEHTHTYTHTHSHIHHSFKVKTIKIIAKYPGKNRKTTAWMVGFLLPLTTYHTLARVAWLSDGL